MAPIQARQWVCKTEQARSTPSSPATPPPSLIPCNSPSRRVRVAHLLTRPLIRPPTHPSLLILPHQPTLPRQCRLPARAPIRPPSPLPTRPPIRLLIPQFCQPTHSLQLLRLR